MELRDENRVTVVFSSNIVPFLQLIMTLYALFQLENTYRFAEKYQKLIGRFCFISLFILGIYQLTLYGRILLFKYMPIHFSELSSVIYGITYPVMITGLLRYRLVMEKVSIPREAVYSSITLLLTGAFFLGVGFLAFLFKWFHIDFTYFEKTLFIFSLCLFIALGIGSGTMRKRITRVINDNFYTRKYDYQKQFFQLNQTLMAGDDLDSAVVSIVENMKYSVTVDNAFVFFHDLQDGNYYIQNNKEQSTKANIILSSDNNLIKILEENKKSFDILNLSGFDTHTFQEFSQDLVMKELKVDAVFPILNGDEFLGILALSGGRSAHFDDEDVELINAFTNSLGGVIFKTRILNERIEQKQFESFSHVASFLIHDIKNQVATLSLISKNADKNLHNPAFHQSMLTSVRSCSKNLTELIDKLSSAPKQQQLNIENHTLSDVIDEVINSSGVKILQELDFTVNIDEEQTAKIDRQSLFFILKNLFQNALEAMDYKGLLTVTSGRVDDASDKFTKMFFRSVKFFNSFNHYILVEDDGPGMSDKYIRGKMFSTVFINKREGIWNWLVPV